MATTNIANIEPSNTIEGVSPFGLVSTSTHIDATVKVEPSLSMDATAPFRSVRYLIATDPRSPVQAARRDHHIADPLESTTTIASTNPVLTNETKPIKAEFCLAFGSLEDSTLIGLVDTQGLPRTPTEFNKFRFDPEYQAYPHVRVIGIYVARLSRNNGNGKLPPGGHQAVHDMLKSLFKIEGLTPEIDNEYKYTWILKTIMGESNLATRPYEFPFILVEQASIVLGHFQDDLNIGIAIDASPAPPAPTLPTPASKKPDRKKPGSKKREAEDISTDDPIQRKVFDAENPKIAAIMHNIQRGTRRNLKIIDPTLKTSYNKFGNNGLKVGDWWPYQACALGDGAHGSAMGGIAGGATDGAKSIVVGGKSGSFPLLVYHTDRRKGGYEGMDKDEGKVIYYSGSNSHENVDPNTPHVSNGTKSLQRSMKDSRKIRVLRNAKGDSHHAPSVGVRYDGLYKIIAEEKRFNAKGGAYLRFKLVRQEGQADIDHTRPNHQEKRAFAILKQSL